MKIAEKHSTKYQRIVFLIFIFCLIIFCRVTFVSGVEYFNNFKSGSEPDGFRGIKWGTNLKNISGMRHIGTGSSGVEMYSKEGDNLKIGGAVLTLIEYHFWRGKLMSVKIYCKGKSNYIALKDAAFEKFGVGIKDDEYTKQHSQQYTEQYFWFGDKAVISLDYNEISGKGDLYMCSKKIWDERSEYIKQELKEEEEINR